MSGRAARCNRCFNQTLVTPSSGCQRVPMWCSAAGSSWPIDDSWPGRLWSGLSTVVGYHRGCQAGSVLLGMLQCLPETVATTTRLDECDSADAGRSSAGAGSRTRRGLGFGSGIRRIRRSARRRHWPLIEPDTCPAATFPGVVRQCSGSRWRTSRRCLGCGWVTLAGGGCRPRDAHARLKSCCELSAHADTPRAARAE